MTPARQPQCDHWRVCKFASDLLYCPADAAPPRQKVCLFDSRTHTSPQAPAPDEKCYIITENEWKDCMQVLGFHSPTIAYQTDAAIRSRPCTPAPEYPHPFCKGCNNENTTCYECIQHDAQVAKAAREQVLPYLEELASPSVSDVRKREIVDTIRAQQEHPSTKGGEHR